MSSNALAIIERAKARLAILQAEKVAAKAAEEKSFADKLLSSSRDIAPVDTGIRIDRSRDWNERQSAAIMAALTGKSFALIGAAGTGKTSVEKGIVATLRQNNMLPIIQPWEQTKYLHAGKPGIACVSFTNMAVRQIQKHFDRSVTCVTIHKLVEYGPEFYEVDDPVTGATIRKMRMIPKRNKYNKLPASLKLIIVDEGSMVTTELIQNIIDALPFPDRVQWIFVGDLNQLPPVYGHAILGKKMLELPIIELTEVYRQALESPIISFAHEIKNGKGFPVMEKTKQVIDKGEHGKLTVHPWSAKIDSETAVILAGNHMKACIKHDIYDPFTDIILCPQYKVGESERYKFGLKEMNSMIADYLGKQRGAEVHEVIAGFQKHYLAEGDKVLFAKREAVITHIQRNRNYYGTRPLDATKYTIDRWGGASKRDILNDPNSNVWEAENDDTDVDAILASMVSNSSDQVEDRKNASSHQITVRFLNGTHPASWSDTDDKDNCETFEEWMLDTAAEVNDMLGGYGVTIHKSQGSEWNRVYCFFHSSHATMMSREMLYTAATRAKNELYIICEPDRGIKAGSITNAAKKPRLKGNTLAEKLASLKVIFDKVAAEEARKSKKSEEEMEDEE